MDERREQKRKDDFVVEETCYRFRRPEGVIELQVEREGELADVLARYGGRTAFERVCECKKKRPAFMPGLFSDR